MKKVEEGLMEFVHLKRRIGSERYDHRLIEWLILRKFIPREKNIFILDLASGKGGFYFALKKLGYKNVLAVDSSPQFDECINEDLFSFLDKHRKHFDVIISRDVLEHIDVPEKFFEKQHRALREGGRIIVMTPNAEHLSIGEFYDDYTHVRPYTRKSLREALIMHKFARTKVTRLRAIPRLWVYTPKAFDFLFSNFKNNLLGIGIK